MDVKLVDPRDQVWEDLKPRYRVTIWEAGDKASADYDVTSAGDVRDVLRWASTQAPTDGRWTVSLVCDIDGFDPGLGLILMGGSDTQPEDMA